MLKKCAYEILRQGVEYEGAKSDGVIRGKNGQGPPLKIMVRSQDTDSIDS